MIDVSFTHGGNVPKHRMTIRNKAAIALQCKSNVKLIAAMLFIPYSLVVLFEEIAAMVKFDRYTNKTNCNVFLIEHFRAFDIYLRQMLSISKIFILR